MHQSFQYSTVGRLHVDLSSGSLSPGPDRCGNNDIGPMDFVVTSKFMLVDKDNIQQAFFFKEPTE